jgi:hypothetical protein
MKTSLMVYFYFMIVFETCFAQDVDLVQVAQHQFVGDADSLSTLREMRVGEHTLSLNRWYSSRPIHDVLEQISHQVPEDTFAWSNGSVLQMIWNSSEYSHLLALMPNSDQRVELWLSSIRLTTSRAPDADSLKKSLSKENQTWVIADALKRLFLKHVFSSSLMLEVRDPEEKASSATYIFSSAQPIDLIDQAARHALSNQGWVITQGIQQDRSSFQSRSIQAFRPGVSLRIDCMTVLGETFIYVNMLGGVHP